MRNCKAGSFRKRSGGFHLSRLLGVGGYGLGSIARTCGEKVRSELSTSNSGFMKLDLDLELHDIRGRFWDSKGIAKLISIEPSKAPFTRQSTAWKDASTMANIDNFLVPRHLQYGVAITRRESSSTRQRPSHTRETLYTLSRRLPPYAHYSNTYMYQHSHSQPHHQVHPHHQRRPLSNTLSWTTRTKTATVAPCSTSLSSAELRSGRHPRT